MCIFFILVRKVFTLDYKGLKINTANNSITGNGTDELNEVKNNIKEIYDSADQMFGNIDYTNLNAALAEMLKRASSEDYAYPNKDTKTTEGITQGYVRYWESVNGLYSGKCYEEGMGNFRQVVGIVTVTGTPATDSIYFPHPFDSPPFVVFNQLMAPVPIEMNNISGNQYPNRAVKLKIGAPQYKDRIILTETGVSANYNPHMQRKYLIAAIGTGDYYIVRDYVRPDYNPY